MRKDSQQLIWLCDGTWILGNTFFHLMMTLTPMMMSWSPWRFSYDPLTYCGLMHLLVMQPTKKPTIEETLETLKKSLMHMVVGDVVFNTLFWGLWCLWNPWVLSKSLDALLKPLVLWTSPRSPYTCPCCMLMGWSPFWWWWHPYTFEEAHIQRLNKP